MLSRLGGFGYVVFAVVMVGLWVAGIVMACVQTARADLTQIEPSMFLASTVLEPEPESSGDSEPTPQVEPSPESEPSPEPTVEPTPEPTPTPTPEPIPADGAVVTVELENGQYAALLAAAGFGVALVAALLIVQIGSSGD